MIFAAGIEFVDIIETLWYLVITRHPLWPKRSRQRTDLIGLEQLVFVLPRVLYPYLQLTVIFKRADIDIPSRINQPLLPELLHQRILLPVQHFLNLGNRTLVVNKVNGGSRSLRGKFTHCQNTCDSHIKNCDKKLLKRHTIG